MKILLRLIAVGLVIGGLVGLGMAISNKKVEKEVTIVGGDKDEHGCIGSAGYSWCQVKNKCLREWEEKCDESVVEAIRVILAAKYNKPLEEVSVTVATEDRTGARGGVKFGAGGIGEGGLWVAAREDGGWKLLFDGNGSADCSVLKAAGLSTVVLTGVCE